VAMDAAYATAKEYRDVIGKVDTTQDNDILLDLKSISRYLEGKLGRFFNKDDDDVTRIYIAYEYSPELWVDDLSAAPTSIKIDRDGDGVYEIELETTDYELHPLNADKGPEARPFTQIHLLSWGNYPSFHKGDRVEIVAKWGWPAVPDAIKRATIHLAAILRIETPRATRRIAELGDTIEASIDAQNIVKQITYGYMKKNYV